MKLIVSLIRGSSLTNAYPASYSTHSKVTNHRKDVVDFFDRESQMFAFFHDPVRHTLPG